MIAFIYNFLSCPKETPLPPISGTYSTPSKGAISNGWLSVEPISIPQSMLVSKLTQSLTVYLWLLSALLAPSSTLKASLAHRFSLYFSSPYKSTTSATLSSFPLLPLSVSSSLDLQPHPWPRLVCWPYSVYYFLSALNSSKCLWLDSSSNIPWSSHVLSLYIWCQNSQFIHCQIAF